MDILNDKASIVHAAIVENFVFLSIQAPYVSSLENLSYCV
jgi:hypothetical protein